MEATRFGPQAYSSDLVPEPPRLTVAPGLHDELVTAYLKAAIHTVTDILLESTGSVTAWNGRPMLIVMSDEPTAWKTFASHRLGRRFRIVSTPPADVVDPGSEDEVTESRESAQTSKDGGFVSQPGRSLSGLRHLTSATLCNRMKSLSTQ